MVNFKTVLDARTGLYAITSMTTLLISPYSRYPDWFDGRHVKIEPHINGVEICFFSNGPTLRVMDVDCTYRCTYSEAKNVILTLCRERL